MRIVSWNCNGGFRKKYKELFNVYPDADLFMVQECENPDFYNSREYKALFQKGFHVGTPDYSMKGVGVFAPKGNWLRRTNCKYGNALHMLGYAFFEVDNTHKMLAVWPHGKYVEEMIDFFHLNETLFTDDLLIMGDTNSCSVFNNHHPKKKNHDVLVELLQGKGLVDAYNHITGEVEGEETVPTFYLQRKKEKPYHLDRCFVAPECIVSLKVAASLIGLLIILFAVGAWIGMYIIVAVIAQKRHRSVVIWVLLSMIASPLLMIIILLVVGDDNRRIDQYDR